MKISEAVKEFTKDIGDIVFRVYHAAESALEGEPYAAPLDSLKIIGMYRANDYAIIRATLDTAGRDEKLKKIMNDLTNDGRDSLASTLAAVDLGTLEREAYITFCNQGYLFTETGREAVKKYYKPVK